MPKPPLPSQSQRYTWQNFRAAAREITAAIKCGMRDAPAITVGLWAVAGELLSTGSSIVAGFAHVSFAPSLFIASVMAGVATIMMAPRIHQLPSMENVEKLRSVRPKAYRLGTAAPAIMGAAAGGAAGLLAKLVL